MSLKRTLSHDDESSSKRRRTDSENSDTLSTQNNTTSTLAAILNRVEPHLSTFKRVLSPEKFDNLRTLIEQLHKCSISRQDFEKRYFEIMLPYVIPRSCPEKYTDESLLTALSPDMKRRFFAFFDQSRQERERTLSDNPDLIPVLHKVLQDSYLSRKRNTSEERVLILERRVDELERKLRTYTDPEPSMFQCMDKTELSALESTQEKLLSYIREAKKDK